MTVIRIFLKSEHLQINDIFEKYSFGITDRTSIILAHDFSLNSFL